MDEGKGEIETVGNGGCAGGGQCVLVCVGGRGLPFCSAGVGGDDDGVGVV